MQTNGTSARRLIAIAGLIFALVFGLWCLLWYGVGDLGNPEEVYPFLGVGLVHLTASGAFFIAARTRWRWGLLLITLPCIYDVLWTSVDMWSWSHMAWLHQHPGFVRFINFFHLW
jgi:hypothetical protein